MPDSSAASTDANQLSPKSRRIGFAVVGLIRLLSATFRWNISDPDNLLDGTEPRIWAFWHNRIFAIPAVQYKRAPQRNVAILSSASKDGEIIAAVMIRLGMSSIRGSSSRRGTSALLKMKSHLEAGGDVGVVPDGPRGPRYKLGPGVVKLSQLSGVGIVPVRVDYGSAWVFRSWDRFRLPKPFSTVTVTFGPLVQVEDGIDSEQFEIERKRVETLLNQENETD